MSEAIIARGGKGSVNGSSSNQLVANIITITTLFVVPDNVRDNKLYVRIFGAGGGGSMFGGGGGAGDGTHQTYGAGSGYVSNKLIRLNKNEAVYVTIGDSAGWYQTSSGGTSSFGTYLSAAGGISGEDGIAGSGGNSGNRWNSGILYYNSSNNMRISTTGGTIRLYRGDGGNIRAVEGIGGCVIVRYVN